MKKLKYKVGEAFVGYKFESDDAAKWYEWKEAYIGKTGEVKRIHVNFIEVIFKKYDSYGLAFPIEYLDNKIQDKLK